MPNEKEKQSKRVTRLGKIEKKLVAKGSKAVDEGRDKKADRVLGRAAKVEDSKIRLAESKKGGAMKPVATLKRVETTYSKSKDGTTRTKYPEKNSSSGTKSQLTKIATPEKKKK